VPEVSATKAMDIDQKKGQDWGAGAMLTFETERIFSTKNSARSLT